MLQIAGRMVTRTKCRCAFECPKAFSVAAVVFTLFLTPAVHQAIAENANHEDFGPYLEVYPPTDTTQDQLSCVPSDNVTCPLYVAVTMSFGGEYLSSGVIASIQYAIDQINNDSSLLPGYSIHYTLSDSRCNRTVSLGAFHTQIINPPTKIAAIGSGCSIATEASAEISHFYNITQLSCVSSSAALSNRIKFPSYFQLLTPDADLSDGFLAIIQKFGWKRVAIITQEENLLTVTMDRLKKSLDDNKIEFTERRFETDKGVESLGDNPFDPKARIFIAAMYQGRAQHLMCKAYKHKKRYPQYLFLFLGWYDDNWWTLTGEELENVKKIYPDCTSEHIASVVPYSLAPLLAEFLSDQNESTVTSSGINGTEYRMQYERYLKMSRFNITATVYSQHCYDATWALAYALNDTLTDIQMDCSTEEAAARCSAGLTNSTSFGLQHFLYNNSKILQKVKGHLEETNFTGITGEITFDRNGVRRVGKTVVMSYQPCDEETCGGSRINIRRVGITRRVNNGTVMFFFTTTDKNIWGAAGTPYDGVPSNSTETITFPVAITLIGLGTLGIVFAVTCLCFNFAFRNKPLIRLTSPNLNYLIGIGAIILYINIILSVVPTINPEVLIVLCNLTIWLNAIGYSLCFGTIVVKMWRVYYIFNNPIPTKKVNINDWILALIVLLLVGIDVFILTIYMAVDGAQGMLGPTTLPDRETFEIITGELMRINRFHIIVCHSTGRDIALGILYGYKGLLQVVAILFAFSTRKVKVKGLDDAKYIAIAVYVTSIVTAIIILATYTLYDYRNALSVVLSIGILVGATVILILVFIPNMVALYKDPEGTSIFSKQQPASSSHSHPHSKRISRSGTKATQDLSTTTEVESLRKRVNELESQLAAMKESESSCVNELDPQT